MARPTKQAHIMQYTEIVYRDASGAEIARERQHDDHTYEILPEEPMSSADLADFDMEEAE